jgi:hypothetical protein
VLRSLTYFADAESEPVSPGGLTVDRWRTIREYFERAAPQALLARTD